MTVENLSTARVLVVDDKPDEAVPILTALGTLGVGCVYVKGDREEDLPPDPGIEGIRLVFLDMRLDEGGSSRIVLSKTVGVLRRCVCTDTMPLVVVCWTKHEEDIEEFKRMAVAEIPGLRHGSILGMPKPSGSDPATWSGVLQQIRKVLAPCDAVGVIWKWESVLHKAATGTSQALADVSASMAGSAEEKVETWDDGMFAVCRELVRAEVGQSGKKQNVSNALFRMMNALALDMVQHFVLSDPLPCATKLLPQPGPELGMAHISQLNGRLLVEPVNAGDRSCPPGSVIIAKRFFFEKSFRERTGFATKGLAKNFLDTNKHSGLKELKQEIVKLERRLAKNPDDKTAEKLGQIHSAVESFATMVAKRCRPVLVEISPSCDYAQEKRPVPRFIGGIAIPEQDSACVKRSDFLHSIGPMTVPSMNGIWQLLLSHRHMFSIVDLMAGDHPPTTCRLRDQALVELRTWIAFRSARPGIASMDRAKSVKT